MMRGGSLDGVTAHAESLDIELGDNVIMLLGKDTNSIWGDSYSPISVTKSTYVLEGDVTKNKLPSKIMDKTKLKDRLKNLSLKDNLQ